MRAKVGLPNRSLLVSVGFLLVVPTLAHLLFSWRGFAPVDDGFTLAYSRRILEGQIPHRDFIIIRPFISPLIHTPFVLFGGEYTFWVSRFFVWFQFACISWAWVAIVDRAFGNPFGNVAKVFVALASFAASVHYFVLTAWHTVDGLFLASIGVWILLTKEHKGTRVAGYLLISAAYLCKQSFLFVAPMTLVILGDWREKKYWLTIALPAAGYGAYLLVTGAFSEAVLQLATQSGILSTGVGSYLNLGLLIGVLAGFCLVALSSAAPSSRRVYAGAAILTVLPAAFIAIGLYRGSLAAVSFGVFGMVLGVVLYSVWKEMGGNDVRVKVTLISLLLAWSTSLSVGYNFPALLLGPLFTVLAAFSYSRREALNLRFLQITLVIAVVAILLGFGVARPNFIYREQPSSELTQPLDGVLPGGRLIYTNPNTYEFLADLRSTTEAVSERDRKYAILPDVAGWWVQSEQTNPLLVDWPQPVELGNRYLIERVTSDLEDERGEVTVIVQKVHAFYLAEGSVPLDEDQYPVVQYVRANFEKTGETEFFELYE